ncbi:MAG: hypothetical protein ACFUZC_02215 [Chthoniobacteraceae bacterium]
MTLVEVMVTLPIALLCVTLLLTVIWIGTRLVARNLTINLAHVDVAMPMQTLADDVHASIAMPVLTGALTGAGVLPPGLGGSKTASSGKMTAWSLASPTGGNAPGLTLYVVTSATAQVDGIYGSYLANYAAFPVASGNYSSSSTSLSLELVTEADKALFTSAAGMHLCLPGAGIVATTSTNMVDVKISKVSFAGTAGTSASNSTLVATCALSSTLGTSFSTAGARSTTSSYVYQAYLVAPVTYVVCGTDLVRINYDGSWKIVMRNLLKNDTTTIAPFSLPYPNDLGVSFLTTSTVGRRAVTVRFATTNPDYSNLQYGTASMSNMLLYDVTLWSRAQFYDEISR